MLRNCQDTEKLSVNFNANKVVTRSEHESSVKPDNGVWFIWSPAVTSGNGDHLIQVERLIQVAQNTGQSTMKMPFCITVSDVVYSLCIKALKKSLTR